MNRNKKEYKLNIFKYEDPVTYLRDKLQEKVNIDTTFNIRKWSNMMDLNNPKVLKELLDGKRPLKLKHYSFIEKGLSLNKKESQFFKVLIKYYRSKNEEEKVLYKNILNNLSKDGPSCLSESSIIGNWLSFALLSLISLNKKYTYSSISKVFKHQVNLERIKSTIANLTAFNLINKDKDGVFHIVESDLNEESTQKLNDISNKSVHSYYEEAFTLGIESISTPVAEREFQCFILAIEESDLPEYKQEIRNFREKLLRRFDTKKADMLYQVNLQFFPITKKLDH